MTPFLRRLVTGALLLAASASVGGTEAAVAGGDADSLSRAARGLGPVLGRTFGPAPGLSVSGYGEFLYENFDREREDGAPSAALDRVDALRHALVLGYRFSDELVFDSAIEIEHAGIVEGAPVAGTSDPLTGAVEGEASLSGEVVLGFAFLEWSRRPVLGVRAGLLLLPIGLVNERPEPASFHGARRPEVERWILPATWRAAGLGLVGATDAWSWRAYLTTGLDAARFSATGIRDGRPGGGRARMTQPGLTARADWSGVPGLTVGGSLHHGDTWQDFQPAGADLEPRLTLGEMHATWSHRGFEARALWARGSLDDAGPLSDALGLTGTERIGGAFHGAYAEVAWDALRPWRAGSSNRLLPFVRWERLDTQEHVSGGAEDPALERTALTAGVSWRVHPGVVVKADREFADTEARTGVSQWNLALGYQF